MLTNSLVAGALVGAYVVVLVLQLNPMVQLRSQAVARVMLTWWAFYCLHATAFFYGLIVLRQLLAVDVRSPAWVSLRVLAAFGPLAAVMSAIVSWLNLHGFRSGTRSRIGVTHDRRRNPSLGLRGDLCGARTRATAFAPWPTYRRCRVCRFARSVACRSVVASRARRLSATAETAGRAAVDAAAVGHAGSDDSRRRRFTRFHRAECRRRTASELRPRARRRGGDAPGHLTSDTAGPRLDSCGNRQTSV